tara:strand:+ start:6893 stop:8266 length:1374 start_codon:yes stop_codon:yes gene_type:complete
MKFHSGTYGKETQESNALVTNLLKYPEIAKTLIRQYPQYSLNYFLDGTSRFAKEELIGENAFRWPILGRLNRPSTCTGVITGTGVGNSTFTVEFEENFLNPNDVVRFAGEEQAIVMGEPAPSVGGYLFSFILQTNDPLAVIAPASVGAGLTANTVGSAFPEGSDRGYENHVYPDWYINHIGIARKSKSITGSALTDVTWIENNGQRVWFFTDEKLMREEFLYQKELDSWYSTSTMDANGNSTVIGTDGKPIVKGDGVLRQIDAANVDTYNGQLTEKRLTDFLAQLQLNTGSQEKHWMVFTGVAGKVAFHEAMKDLVYPAGNLVYDAQVGADTEIGVNFTSYNALGSRLTLVHNSLFDDPNLHGNNIDPVSGFPKESFRMVFLDMGTTDGVANIERKVKGAAGMDRGMIIKYISGMVNPFNQSSMEAANSRDAFTCEVLCESGIIVRNPLSCGQLVFA